MAGEAREIIDEQLQRIGDEIMAGLPSSWTYVLILHQGDCDGKTTWISNAESPQGTLRLLKKCADSTDVIIKQKKRGA